MLKKTRVLLILLLIMSLTTSPIFAESKINMIVNGRYLSLDVPPTIIEGRTLVPVRGIFEAFKITPNWNNQTRTVTTSSNPSISLTIDSDIAIVNGEKIKLDVPAKIIEGRTMVPARFIAETLGADVKWNNTKRTVIIMTDDIEYVVDSDRNTSMFWDIGFYMGEVLNGVPNGYGIQTYAGSSEIHVGQFKDGKANGHGILSIGNDSNMLQFEGEFKNGLLNGIVTARKNGKELKNEWINGAFIRRIEDSAQNEEVVISKEQVKKDDPSNNDEELFDYKNDLLETIESFIYDFEGIIDSITPYIEEITRVYEKNLSEEMAKVEKRKEEIYSQAYNEMERTKLYMSEMGISNNTMIDSINRKYEEIIDNLESNYDKFKDELTAWRDSNLESYQNDYDEVNILIDELMKLKERVKDSKSIQELNEIERLLN